MVCLIVLIRFLSGLAKQVKISEKGFDVICVMLWMLKGKSISDSGLFLCQRSIWSRLVALTTLTPLFEKIRFLWVSSFHWSTLRCWDGISRRIQRNQSTAAVYLLEIWPCLRFLQKTHIKQNSDKKHVIRSKWKSQKSDCYSVQRRALNHGSTRQEMVPEATEFRFSVGVTRMDRIKNECIRQRREVTLSLDMCAGGILGILREWCWRWSCQARGKEEGQK